MVGGSLVGFGEHKTILFFRVKGLGENSFSPPPGEDSYNPNQGYHHDSFERQIIF